MKTELIVIENDAELAEGIALVEALMAAADVSGIARLRAQARLVEDYELRRWPRKVPSTDQLLSYLMEHEGEADSEACSPRGVMDWLSGLRTRAQARVDGQPQTDSADLIQEARDSRSSPLELAGDADEPARRHWNYRLLRHSDGCLAIHEAYYNTEGHPTSATERPVGIVGDDVEEVRRVLEMMARSLGEPVLDYQSFIPGQIVEREDPQ
jgi:hypothetical protein